MTFIIIPFIIFLIIICIFFFFYRKVLIATQSLITIMFFAGLIGSISAIFIPIVYKAPIENYFSESLFGVQLQYADSTLTTVGSVPADLKNKIESLFDKDNVIDAEFKSELYPSFINLISVLLRIFIFVISILLMIVATYMRYSFAGIRDYHRLEKRVKELESNQE
ncbi:hypothetical protein KC678_01910 [Candidatus Dojkabacteria bacterium]|uniref:Uncharacterized protein n=1 Tax=Candidatus Dojkabacteria bacterium TaxID=2099670 RepID=A0A955IAR0_9BACT|nr:hypothetical protein [Candidatus Dojkabacteria bacterium]